MPGQFVEKSGRSFCSQCWVTKMSLTIGVPFATQAGQKPLYTRDFESSGTLPANNMTGFVADIVREALDEIAV